jgi:hypothetical protein
MSASRRPPSLATCFITCWFDNAWVVCQRLFIRLTPPPPPPSLVAIHRHPSPPIATPHDTHHPLHRRCLSQQPHPSPIAPFEDSQAGDFGCNRRNTTEESQTDRRGRARTEREQQEGRKGKGEEEGAKESPNQVRRRSTHRQFFY